MPVEYTTQRLEQTVSQSGGQQSNTGGCCLVDKESKAEGGLLHARVSRARRLGRRFSHSVSGVSVLVRVVAHAVFSPCVLGVLCHRCVRWGVCRYKSVAGKHCYFGLCFRQCFSA